PLWLEGGERLAVDLDAVALEGTGEERLHRRAAAVDRVVERHPAPDLVEVRRVWSLALEQAYPVPAVARGDGRAPAATRLERVQRSGECRAERLRELGLLRSNIAGQRERITGCGRHLRRRIECEVGKRLGLGGEDVDEVHRAWLRPLVAVRLEVAAKLV